MNNNLTEIVFILDRSGSMAGVVDDTIGGFNAFIEKQKKEDGDALLSTVLFSDGTDTREIRVYYVHTNQAVDDVTAEQPASKMMRDGQVYILRDGQSFSVQGLPLYLTKKR